MSKIFISYRRTDSQYVTDTVYDHMVRHFGKDSVFLDVGSIPIAVDFREYLRDQIQAYDVVLVVIGPDWGRIMAERAGQDNDFVRIEIENAFRLEKLVVPVLVKGAQMPDFAHLPESIQRLQWLNAAQVRRHPDLERDCTMLADNIKQVMEARHESPAPQVPPLNSGEVALQRRRGSPTVADILPPPFEWIDIPGGKVTLEGREGSYIPKGKTKTFTVEPFAIAKYPTTNAQYQVFVDAPDGYRETKWWDYSDDARKWRAKHPQPEDTAFGGDNHPRTNVNWFDSVAFCRWLTSRVGITTHASSLQITLPTEQQWQRAAQGDTNRTYPWGENIDSSYCNYNSNVGQTTPVTQYPKGASPYGVMDMSGNVWEWCLTELTTGLNDLYRTSELCVIRGGSWDDNAADLHGTDRLGSTLGNSGSYDGFRCTLS